VTPIFADTSFFIALLYLDDDFHERAQALSASQRHRPLITTSAIIQELGASFHRIPDRPLFLSVLTALQHGGAEIVHVDESLQRRAIELFERRADKDWSLADCISFLVLEARGLTEAASSDRHFEEAGFVALLRKDQG